MNPKPEGPGNAAGDDKTNPDAHSARDDAIWAEKAGLPDRAVAAYRKVAALCPGDFDAHSRLASLLLTLGRPAEALEAGQRALALRPDDFQANASVGQACLRLGQGERAVPFLRSALAVRPDLHALRKKLAETLLDLGRKAEAIAAFAAVADQFGGDAAFLAEMGAICRRADAGPLAERVYQRLLEVAPGRHATYNDLAQLHMDFTRYTKAREVAQQGLKLQPDQPALLNTLALAQASLGLVKDAVASYRRIIELAPNMATSHSNMLLTMHYTGDTGAEELAEEHRRWGRLHAPPGLATRVFRNAPDPGRRLRVGYVSPDFRRHSVAFFFESLLDWRDPAEVEVICYGEVRSPDEVTQRIKAKADGYRNIADLPDAQVAELIKSDSIDILIDLAGHAGSSRTTLLGYKPAPVQVTYCGYPDTTGIEAVDYRITDWLADPAGVEGLYTETLCRLPGPFLCFRPPESLPGTVPRPSPGVGPVTFGSFNREFKASQDTYDMWCRILRALPGSRMIMKSIAGSDPGTRELQLGEFSRRGIAPDRIELLGFVDGQANHLACYQQVDIALDTYPYHGTTTTLEAMLMGVPVLTRSGYNHASRVGVSLLTHVGLGEFIAAGADDYVERAVALAGQPRRLADLHQNLREQLLRSPLCDGPRFNRGFEYALRGMWCRWCRTQGATLTPEQAAMAAFDFGPLVTCGPG